MSDDLATRKAALRRHLRSLLEALPAGQREAGSREICRRLTPQDVWIRSRSVMLFASTRFEPDLAPLFSLALAQGKRLILPRYVSREDRYEAAAVSTPGELTPGRYGIAEPRARNQPVPLNELDLAVVPGVGFSPRGIRLGRGKGYFDRLLAGVRGVKCGVAFDCQVTVDVPMEPHDVVLNCILTPTRWLEVTSPGRA